MATTTPNFGWIVPTSTDLVKDGATAIETLGDGVDASFVGLKGGTTGQVLSKTSNTDLAFTWVAADDTNAIQNAIVDAKGDLIAATAADTPARLGVGTNGQFLSADSTAATGLAWATPAGGSMTSIASGSLSTGTLSLTSISGSYKDLRLVLRNANTNSNCNVTLTINNVTAASYSRVTIWNSDNTFTSAAQGGVTSTQLNGDQLKGGRTNTVIVDFKDYANTTSYKQWTAQVASEKYLGSNMQNAWTLGTLDAVTAISRIDLTISGTTFSAGTYILYGVN